MTIRTLRRRAGARRPGFSSCLVLASLIGGNLAAIAVEAVSFVDQNGRTITLAGPAARVVTIPKPAPSMFVAVDGASSRLVGMHPQSKTVLLEGILGRFFPEMAGIPTDVVGDGFAPNVEELLRVDPQLVFQWAWTSS
jgi:iron complex transport system substrate-binding protein